MEYAVDLQSFHIDIDPTLTKEERFDVAVKALDFRMKNGVVFIDQVVKP